MPRFEPRSELFRKVLLRRQTNPEREFATILRKFFKGMIFIPQHKVEPYIVDFMLPEHGIVIEIDGPTHWDKESRSRDRARTRYINKHYGYRVVRFTNTEVIKNPATVAQTLHSIIAQRRQKRRISGDDTEGGTQMLDHGQGREQEQTQTQTPERAEAQDNSDHNTIQDTGPEL